MSSCYRRFRGVEVHTFRCRHNGVCTLPPLKDELHRRADAHAVPVTFDSVQVALGRERFSDFRAIPAAPPLRYFYEYPDGRVLPECIVLGVD